MISPAFARCSNSSTDSGTGMATGGWLAGLLYDHFGTYVWAFAAGVAANAVNLVIIGTLVFQQRRVRVS